MANAGVGAKSATLVEQELPSESKVYLAQELKP